MSPLISDVAPVVRRTEETVLPDMGFLKALDDSSRRLIESHSIFIDAWSANLFIAESRALGYPLFEILRSRPELNPPSVAELQAGEIVRPYANRPLVAINFIKAGGEYLAQHFSAPGHLLADALMAGAVILNFISTKTSFSHWPRDARELREAQAMVEARVFAKLPEADRNIVNVVNVPISCVTALLKRCCYFIGVNNGIKHIAWALNLPLTCLVPSLPDGVSILRWMPDFHRALEFDASEEAVKGHARNILNAIKKSRK
jgi:hypothetical protein